MKKISNGPLGMFRIVTLGICTLIFFLPFTIFPQQQTQIIDTLTMHKAKYQTPDIADSISQDYIRHRRSASDQDPVLNILPQVKPDYSNFTLIIQINDGQQYTRSREVNLNLIAPNATEMILSNRSDFSDGQWESFKSIKPWILTGDDGNQRVYFQVRYPDSTISKAVSDDIFLSSVPPVAKFKVTPDSGIAGETWFQFDATESSPQSDIYFRWDWEGDGQFDTDWTQSATETHQYRLGGGSKEVVLEVKDSSGWLVSVKSKILVYSRPYPDFSYTQNFENPLMITFDASISGDYEDGNNLQYRWNFNADTLWDSDLSPSSRFIYLFEPFDSVLVRLEAKDSQGITNQFSSIVVNSFNDMVYVPAGEFIMGHDDFDIDERPAHTVFISAFWIDKFPVTNKKYAHFLNEYILKYAERASDIACFIDLSDEGSRIKYEAGEYIVIYPYDDHPVVNVTWNGADAYARFYDKQLPTEAEWEKAARGTDQRIYPWGNTVDSSRANYWDSGDPFDNETTPVGFFNGQNYDDFHTSDSPGSFGAYDMGGNVKEWVSDWYLRNYYSQSPKNDPIGPASGMKKVARGGGFLFHLEGLRVTFRYAEPPEKSANFIGFRCVKSPTK